MPDQKNEAFLQREAERENRRKRENKHTLFIFWKSMVLRLGIIGIGLLVVGCFAYSIYCIILFMLIKWPFLFDNKDVMPE